MTSDTGHQPEDQLDETDRTGSGPVEATPEPAPTAAIPPAAAPEGSPDRWGDVQPVEGVPPGSEVQPEPVRAAGEPGRDPGHGGARPPQTPLASPPAAAPVSSPAGVEAAPSRELPDRARTTPGPIDPRSLDWLDDWAFGFCFSVMVGMLAPLPTVIVAFAGSVVTAARLLTFLYRVPYAEAREDASNCRFFIIAIAMIAPGYRIAGSSLIGMSAAFFGFLLLNAMHNVRVVTVGVAKKMIAQEAGQRAGPAAPPPPPPEDEGPRKITAKGRPRTQSRRGRR